MTQDVFFPPDLEPSRQHAPSTKPYLRHEGLRGLELLLTFVYVYLSSAGAFQRLFFVTSYALGRRLSNWQPVMFLKNICTITLK